MKIFCRSSPQELHVAMKEMLAKVNHTHLQRRLVHSSVRNCCDEHPVRPILITFICRCNMEGTGKIRVFFTAKVEHVCRYMGMPAGDGHRRGSSPIVLRGMSVGVSRGCGNTHHVRLPSSQKPSAGLKRDMTIERLDRSRLWIHNRSVTIALDRKPTKLSCCFPLLCAMVEHKKERIFHRSCVNTLLLRIYKTSKPLL